VLIRDSQTDTPEGRLSQQRIATERRPLFEGRGLPIRDEVIRLWHVCHEGHLRAKSVASRLQVMCRTLAVVMVFLAMFWVASPALACLLPGRTMTAAEQACCKRMAMAKMCGSGHMPQSHSCCQTEAQPVNTSIPIADHQFALALQVVAGLSTPLSLPEFALPGLTLIRPPSDSPPDSSVLRV
jgi:hypothetical protein